MRKYIILILCLEVLITQPSCKKYLDKAPESSFSEQEVFSNYDNFKKYFDGVYKGNKPEQTGNKTENDNITVAFSFYISGGSRQFSLEQMTDFSDLGYIREAQPIKGGSMGSIINIFYDNPAQRPQMTAMFKVIRTVNKALKYIDNVKDINQAEKDDILGQAHFVRAFAHYDLFRFWGPFPYITHVIGPYDSWDIPRLSKHETCMRIAADFDTAAYYFEKANKMRRDNPVVGGAGHLNHPDMFRPNGSAAKGFKSRILLFAASPLNNELGTKDWETAAVASWEAIQIALENGYQLLSAENYKQNFVGGDYSNEQLWGWAAGKLNYDSPFQRFLINGVFRGVKGNASGCNPTQNAVDKFETRWGDPLNTQADRDAATALSHYNEQDPYKNRDPRFSINIIYNEAPIPEYGTAKIYYENVGGTSKYSELLNKEYAGLTNTGYYMRKQWGEQSIKNNITPSHTDPIIRLAELYLNYAEAANEAYGPNSPAPGADMTAVDAINHIRQRIGQPDVLTKFTTSTDIFRERIKNERNIELSYEGHYFFDIRRWKDAPVSMAGPLMGMSIEKVAPTAEYPIGYKHTRIVLPANRQTAWKDAMYYFPFKEEDYYKMKNFDLSINPPW